MNVPPRRSVLEATDPEEAVAFFGSAVHTTLYSSDMASGGPLRYARTDAGFSVLAAGALATFTGPAGAAPKPTAAQVQKMVNHLTSQMDQADQQNDEAAQQLASARQRLRTVNHRLQTDQARFSSMRG
jgi:septal ring factor EnvC (AmiA/AmiB activator)